MLNIKGETVIAGSSIGYVHWPWIELDDLTKIIGTAIAIFMAWMAFRKWRLEMKVLNRKLEDDQRAKKDSPTD